MFGLPVTKAVQDLLDRYRVYDSHDTTQRRWQIGGRLLCEQDFRIEPYTQILAGSHLPKAMGAFSYSHSPLFVHVAIGRYCSIGKELSWMGGVHPAGWAMTSPIAYDTAPKPPLRQFFEDHGGAHRVREWTDWPAWDVEIGHDVWIGDGVMIAPHVKIGHGAVIGARALVLKDVGPYEVVAGVPARVLRRRFPDPLVERMLALEWWRYTPDVLQAAAIEDPERFADELPAVVEAKSARVLKPACLTFPTLVAAAKTEG